MGKKKRSPPPSFMTAKGGHEHFTPLYDSLLDSPAYTALSLVAKVMYTILRQKYTGDYSGNRIICSYNMFIEKGISRNSIPGGIRLLEALGFITYESGGLEHQANVFHFSDGWQEIKSIDEAKAIKVKLSEERKSLKEIRQAAKNTDSFVS